MRLVRGRLAATLATVLAVLSTVLLGMATPHAHAAAAGPVSAGESTPVYSYAAAVRESVWVDTGLDLDHDGRTDRVAADIVRPSEPAAAGRRIPVIMDASPYYSCCGRGNESQTKTYDAAGRPAGFPLFYDNYFVPRGYAVVLVDLAGTNRSDGCVDIGGPSDITSARAVVDWLNGRAAGYSARSGGQRVTAGWADGSVGMIGKSWDGTIANGVAATGVKGLKTIVAISAISSWYDYYFSSGGAPFQEGPAWLSDYVESPAAKQHCAAEQQQIVDGSPYNGDWTRFWRERDYTRSAAKVHASVFVVHGLQDLNVRTLHFGQWWDALAAHGVQRKIWLSLAGHVDPFDFARSQWVDTLHRWFDHYLMGVANGIDTEPQATIERSPDHWVSDNAWPAQGTTAVQLGLHPGTTAGLGTLGAGLPAQGAAESFTDDPSQDENAWSAAVDTPTAAKVAFTTGPLTKDLRLSGTGSITLTASASTSSAFLSAVLVDLGPATIRNYLGDGEGITTLSDRTCWGESTSADSACYLRTQADSAAVDYTVFSRGWADLGHYASLHRRVTLQPGRSYTITFKLSTTDHVVPAGHRLALIVAGTDQGLIDPPDTTPKVTLDLARSSVRLPVVGGAAALRQPTAGHVAGSRRGGLLHGLTTSPGALRIPD